jgi:hypothetical protein
MAGAALLVAACGGSPSSGSGGSPSAGGPANSRSAVNASRCIRAHGVPNFPDPNGSGQIPKEVPQQLGVSDSVLEAAQRACQNLWPYQLPPQAQQRQQLTSYLKFARCMRSHGVPNFPDPSDHDGRVEFAISISKDGFDPHSPQIIGKALECKHVLPAGPGLPEVAVSP